MSKVNFITIKNKYNGFTRTLGEPEFNGMIDKTDYEIVPVEKQAEKTKSKPKSKAKPKAKKKN